MTKICRGCRQDLPLDAYGPQKLGRLGRKARCRACEARRMRVHRHGDPDYRTPEHVRVERQREAQLRTRAAKPHTYRKLYGRHEHRVVAEQMLGRPLRPDEIVHHRDGDKHNNAPENLEVMTQSEHLKHHVRGMLAVRRARHGY